MANKAVLAIAFLGATPAWAQSVKDFVDIEGANTNYLTGLGVVVGLNGQGDTPKGPSATRLTSLLKRYSSVDAAVETINAKNAAVVFVTADLPPFVKKGTQIDVRVSVAGDAKSIVGGELMVTDLWSIEGQIQDEKRYAIARGRIIGLGEGRTGNPTAGAVPGGAIVYRDVYRELKADFVKPLNYTVKDRMVGYKPTGEDPNPVVRGRAFRLNLRKTDLTMASELAEQINKKALVGPAGSGTAFKVARALDGGAIEVVIPPKKEWEEINGKDSYPNPGYYDDPVSWAQLILNLNVRIVANPKAVVTIDDVNKRITWTRDVKVLPGEVRVRGGAILRIGDEMTLGEAMRVWQGTVQTQDLIDAIRGLDAAGLLVGKVESR